MKFCGSTHVVHALLGSIVITGFAPLSIAGNTSEFDWRAITPSSDLEYHDCDGNFKCARLILPMDWLNKNNSNNVTIAIRKLPAIVDEDDLAFGGAIFAQPGGPAAPGTKYVLRMGSVLQDAFDKPGKRHYEIISFDIRGVGHSTPKINCSPGVLGYMRTLETVVKGSPDLNSEALAFTIAEAKADWRQCHQIHGTFLSYVGSPNIARDMVAMIDKIEQSRPKTAKNIPLVKGYEDAVGEKLELRSKVPHDSEEAALPRLQYIGVSYGTVFGNTFASMFPGRVGRMVLDGVMDANDVTHGMGWLKNTQDTDRIADMFFQGCFDAGPSLCALRQSNDQSGYDMKERFWIWANELDKYPLITPTIDGHRQLIRSGDIRNLFLWALYNPVASFQPLAADINDAMLGQNLTTLLKRHLEISQIYPPLDGDFTNYSPEPIIQGDAQTAVICADGANVTDAKNSDWREYMTKQILISSLAGAFWASLRMSCAGYKSRPNWVFRGPFKTPEAMQPPHPDRPAAPLLFASNRYDPVTPLRNARHMAESHPGAGILVQEAIGHCLVLGAMSPCSKDALAEYFDTGIVPSGELSCEATRTPWDAALNDTEMDQFKQRWVDDQGLRQFVI